MAITLAATLPSGTDAQNIGANASGGQSLGSSASELVSLHGATPTDQVAFVAEVGSTALEASVSASAIVGFSVGKWSLLIGLVEAMRDALIDKGIMASS